MTAVYSAAITVAPGIRARPCRLTEPDGRVSAAIAAWACSVLELVVGAYAHRRWASRAGTA